MDVGIEGDNGGNVVRAGKGASMGAIAGMVVRGDLVIQLPAQLGTLLREAPTAAAPRRPRSTLSRTRRS